MLKFRVHENWIPKKSLFNLNSYNTLLFQLSKGQKKLDLQTQNKVRILFGEIHKQCSFEPKQSFLSTTNSY
jgi:hypothetical protein